MDQFNHITVLLQETVDLVSVNFASLLAQQRNQIWADCTLGGAGHTLALLDRFAATLRDTDRTNCHIEHLCCDQDPVALEAAGQRLQHWKVQNAEFAGNITVTLLPINFRDLAGWLTENRPTQKISGLIADFGVSSPQIDSAERGFSFLREGPLDMRMNTTGKTTAHSILTTWDANELQRIFSDYGEEPRSRALARAIVQDRGKGLLPLSNTVEFANYVSRVLGYHQSRVHPATRIFQALRIAVNEELSAIEELLEALPTLMHSNSCAGLISFHSLEDRLVKRYFRAWEQGDLTPEAKRKSEKQRWTESQLGLFAAADNKTNSFGREEPRGGIVAGEQELKTNPRARSARLRGFSFANAGADRT
ncbi:MAG: rRNA ((1402)-N(4))-methyltransferase RsmH [Pseudomonadota bacterium]|jgi:16S rRNA (cytosine1402-N4)-methyltransferase